LSRGLRLRIALSTAVRRPASSSGFARWAAGPAAGDPSKPIVTDATKQCFECHQPKKDQDYVYSTYIP
jgi:hypothetical protein